MAHLHPNPLISPFSDVKRGTLNLFSNKYNIYSYCFYHGLWYLTLVIYVSKNKEEYRFWFALFRLVNLQMNFVQVLKHQEIQPFGLKVPQVPARQQVVQILPLYLKHTPRCLQSLFRFLSMRFFILFRMYWNYHSYYC